MHKLYKNKRKKRRKGIKERDTRIESCVRVERTILIKHPKM